MENKVKFRNHISIVAEKMGRTTLFWLIFVFGILIQDLREFAAYTENGAMPLKEIVLVGGGVISFIILIGVYQLVVWSKTYISYDKIQYVRLNQNPLAKICGIQNGDIFLLASLANRVHGIPYLKEKEVEELWGKIIQK